MAEFISPFDPCPPDAKWRIIPCAPDYEVSEYGHVRRAIARGPSKAGRRLVPRLNWNGRILYNLRIDGRPKTMQGHTLVVLAFIGPCPPNKSQIAHWDGKPTNCHHTNLRWATGKENQADARRHGTMRCGAEWSERLRRAPLPRGESHRSAKLTADEVREIRASPLNTVRLAERYGVTNALIGRIKRGLIWRSILEPARTPSPSRPSHNETTNDR